VVLFPAKQEIFLFGQTSRPVLGNTQWVQETVCQWVKSVCVCSLHLFTTGIRAEE